MEHEYTPPILDFTNSTDTVENRYYAIKSMLSDYECMVDFIKVNGDHRSMLCTLREDLMPVATKLLKEDIIEASTNFDVITVWCTDMQGWRAMRTMNIIGVKLSPKKWTVTVEEDPETGDLILPFPEDLLKIQGWKEGDTLKWEYIDDDCLSLKKTND